MCRAAYGAVQLAVWCRAVLCSDMGWYGVLCVLHRIVSHCIASHRIASHRIVSYRIVSYRIVSYHIVSHRIVSYRIVSYRIVSYRIVSYCIVSYRIVSYRIVSYRIVSYCIVLSRLILYPPSRPGVAGLTLHAHCNLFRGQALSVTRQPPSTGVQLPDILQRPLIGVAVVAASPVGPEPPVAETPTNFSDCYATALTVSFCAHRGAGSVHQV